MTSNLVPLAELTKGQTAIVRQIDEQYLPHHLELDAGELERRILEIGIIEGVSVKVLHYGLIRRDPLALQINNELTIAIRRNEANCILVEPVNQ